ncbi:MAG: GcvT family protein [Deltaproteobacteria bacterium]|nr:GcvT family protein [Deltaproteobacteria bacterium]
MSEPTLPQSARVVVIGGGVIGTSVAYHLAKLGCDDVVLLERDRLTSGTTWHAAGLMVTFGSFSETSTELRKYTRRLLHELEVETGQPSGFMPIGFIEVAGDRDRLEEYRRVSALNRYLGIDVHEIGPSEIKDLFPIARVDDLHAGFYVKEDGRVNPVDFTMALARAARMRGVKLIEGAPVTGILQRKGRVAGVTTAHGSIQCEVVVNCAGMWARELGLRAGVSIPLQAAEHYYLITDTVPGLDPRWPVLEDPGSYTYIRPEGDGLMIGLFEPVAAPWKVDGIPGDFSFGEITPDWDRMAPYLDKAMSRVPITHETGIRKLFCGPESFTPDLAPVLGEAPELKGFFVAAGLNSIGILTGGGVGRLMAEWILTGKPDLDVTGMNIDRLRPYQGNPEYRRERIAESLGLVYRCHYPTQALRTARDAKRTPFHDRMAAQGAYFRDVSGWECPDWFAGPGQTPDPGPLGWGKLSWFSTWEREHRACREGVIVMDMSFMSKFLVQGRDAGRVLDHVSANRVDGKVGEIVYTQWLDEDGKLQADVTITKLADDRFMLVATDTAHRHVETWLRDHTPADAHCIATDVTGALAQLNVQGPRARELMQRVTTADMSNEAFPFRASREIDIGYARVQCHRITYLGELGYELLIAAEQAVHVYDRIVAAGAPLGLAHAGLKALASLRMEKGYRDYGHDIDNTDHVLEAGLGFAVDLTKPDFIGKAAVLARKEAPLHTRLVQVQVLDPEPMLFHAEIVLRDGRPVGYVRAGSYGHTLGGAVGLVMVEHPDKTDKTGVTDSWLKAGRWDVQIGNDRFPARVSRQPLYDPKAERVRM